MSYQFFSQIDILASAVGEDEQNFPVALVLTDGRFATTGNGGRVENTDASGGASGSLTVPADLVVGPNEDGSSEYDFEFVDYNVATGYMEFWVEIVALSSSVDTPVVFAYGDPGITTSQEDVTGVWDANFMMVQHMQDETTSTILDSTSSDNDGAKLAANRPIEAAGQIGKAQDFDGNGDYIAIANEANFDFITDDSVDFTIEFWAKGPDQAGFILTKMTDAFAVGMYIYQRLRNANQIELVLATDASNWIYWRTGPEAYTLNTWHRFAWVFDQSEKSATLRIDEDLADISSSESGTFSGGNSAEPLRIGIRGVGSASFDGIKDEVRISNIIRAAEEIVTSYKNQVSPAPSGTFWSALGSEQPTQFTKQVSLDADLKGTLTEQVSLDADLKGALTKQVSLDADLKGTLTKQVSLDAILIGRFVKQVSLDADLKGTLTEQVSLDALLEGAFTKQTSLDALLKGTFTKQTSLDALLKGTFTKQVSLDALLKGTFTKQVSLDADLKGTLTKQVGLDSYLTKETGYKVIIYDSSGNALARVGDHQNLRVRQRVNKTYQLEFDIHRDSENYQHLAIDNLMEVRRNEIPIFAGIIKKPGPKFGEDGKATQYVHIFAPSFEIRQDGRRILPPSGADYMEVTDYVDDAMKYMVRYNAVTGYVTDAKRVLTDLSVEDDTTEHPSSKKLAGKLSGGSLLEHLMRWGDAYSVDFWVDADIEAGTYVFRTKYPQRGLDRTVGNEAGRPHTIFSVGRGNVLDLDYWEDGLDACSLVYVAGPGEGVAQTIRKVYSGAEPEGNARREHFIGATDAEYEDEQEAAGQAYLATWGDPIKGVRFKFQETDSCKYGKDFSLGTLVTVYDADYGISLDRKVEEIEFALGKDGIEEIFVTVGSPQPTQWEMWQARMGPYDSFSQASDGRAPDEPTDLTTYSRFEAVHLKWTNPTQRDLSHIEVWRNSSASWDGATKIAAEVVGTSYTDEIGLWDSTFYYALRAVDYVGNTTDGTAWVVGSTDTVAPAAPTGLSTSSGTFVDADGHIIPYIDCAWTNSTTEDVQSHEIEVQYYIAGEWQKPIFYPCPEGSELRASPVPGNASYRVRVRAVDDAGLHSEPTDWSTGTTAKDNVAPATPTGLSVEPVLKGIRITVDEPSEGDWAGTEYHVSTGSGFTPSAGTLKASGQFTSHTYETTSYVVHYVKLRHYDSSGNYSGYCAQGSATPDKVDPPDDIPDDSIPGDKLPPGSIVDAHIVSCEWAKITNAAIQSAEIVSLVASKITAGTITATISLQSAGTIGFVNGPTLSGSAGNLIISSAVTVQSSLQATSLRGDGGLYVGEFQVITSGRKLQSLTGIATTGDTIVQGISCTGIYLTGSYGIQGGQPAVFGAVTADSCSLIAHGGFGFPDVRVPTSKGLVRLTAVESPAFLFLDVHDEVDPLLEEICEGKVWIAPLYEWRGKGTKLEGKPDRLLVLTGRKGYADVRFELVSEGGVAEALEAQDHSIEHNRERGDRRACQRRGRDRRECSD